MSIKNILIPTDYSPLANRVCRQAASIAEKMGAKLHLLHSYNYPVLDGQEIDYVAQMEEDEKVKIKKELEELKVFHPNMEIEATSVFGSAADNIESFVDEKEIDLIIMGTKGESNRIDAFFGSITSHVINNVKCPTLVIPENVLDFKLQKVMIAADFHDMENKAVYRPLFSIAEKYLPRFFVVTSKHSINELEEPNNNEIALDNFLQGYEHSHHFIESNDAEKGLLEFADEHEVSVIALTTKHYSFWQKLFHTSMARSLTLHSKTPLLILHEDLKR